MSDIKFSCPACRQDISYDAALVGKDITCPHCNAMVVVPQVSVSAAAASSDKPDVTPPPIPNLAEPASQDAPVSVQRTSRLAIASVVCSVASFFTCIGWIPGVICGHMARSRIRRDQSLKGSGLATAGLVLGYLALAVEVGSAVYLEKFSHALKQGFDNVQQNLATNTIIVTQNQPVSSNQPPPTVTAPDSRIADNEVESDNDGWTTDLDKMSFPNHPARGEVHGTNFTFRSATYRPPNLRINSTNHQLVELRGVGDTIEGKSYEIHATDTDKANPRVRILWDEEGASSSVVFSKGYAMRLEFGQAVNGVVSGKIYVCLPDDSKSHIAGTFSVKLPRPK
jgi:hypothetical protein